MEIPKKIKDEIWEYCKANDITDIDGFNQKIFKQGFTLEKYGAGPNTKIVEKEVIKEVPVEVEKIVEIIKEVEVEKIVQVSDDTQVDKLLQEKGVLETDKVNLGNDINKLSTEITTLKEELEKVKKELEEEKLIPKEKQSIYKDILGSFGSNTQNTPNR